MAITAAALAVLFAPGAAFAQTFTGSQVRISQQGPDGSTSFRGVDSDVAFNPATGQYLIVWSGDDDSPPLVDGEDEIFGRLVSATGAAAGAPFRISNMGPDGDTGFDASTPRVAYNSVANEFLVIWRGNEADGDEVYGQRLGAGGVELGTDFRISEMGPPGSNPYEARSPAVAHNPADNRYLVAWTGDDDTAALVNDEFEIFGQLLTDAGVEVGADDFRISDMGPDLDTSFGAGLPDVAANPSSGQYLVSWHGDDDTAPLRDDEQEIFGQRLDGDGAPLGVNDFRISRMGPDGDPGYAGTSPAVAFSPAAGEFLVVWSGNSGFPLDDDEVEVFGQRLSAGGSELGADDFRISQMGTDGFGTFRALHPDVAFNPASNSYLVVWDGDDDTAPLVADEIEVFGQRLKADGSELGADDFRISRMGPDGSTAFGTDEPAIAFGADEFLVAWDSDDSTPPLVDDEREIFARGVAGADPGPDPDPDPVDDAVTLTIVGKKLLLTKKRTTSLRILCPANEASPPCAGKLTLLTRKKVRVSAKRKVRLARKQYSIGAGETRRLKLRLSKKSARLVRRRKAARKVVARTSVSDAAGNRADVSKKLKLKPKKKKKR